MARAGCRPGPAGPHTSTVTHVELTPLQPVDGPLEDAARRGELSARQYVGVAAGSPRAKEVLAEQACRVGTNTAVRAVQAWMADRSDEHWVAAAEELQALAPEQ